MQMIRALVVIAASAAVASAQASGDAPPPTVAAPQAPGDARPPPPTAPAPAPAPASPPAPAPATTPPARTDPSDTPTADDYRDVFAKPKPPDATAPEPTTPAEEPLTGAGRIGVYHDSDATTVLRTLATVAKGWGEWSLTASAAVDAVTSASLDVRSSPGLAKKLNIVTVESGVTTMSGIQMTDERYLGTAAARWHDTSGRAVTMTGSLATNSDYASASAGVNGSLDLDERDVTLLGGLTVTDNWVSSIVDSTFARKLFELGWTAGAARVLAPTDVVRLRYDGQLSDGDQASPYRVVRFGDWTPHVETSGELTFLNTIGSADGLPEKLPSLRLASAVTGEWLHSLALGVVVHTAVRASHDSWGADSVAPSAELRVAQPTWRLELGYRLFLQSRASFFADKYTLDPAMYTHYTSDKELGREVGHLGSFDVTAALTDQDTPNDTRMMLFFHAEVFHYAYPGFELLPSRTSVFGELGLSWEH